MLKIREKESSKVELSTNCVQLKLKSGDGKEYETDCADTEGIFRIIQSIPSKKAEWEFYSNPKILNAFSISEST